MHARTMLSRDISYFATTNNRNARHPFGIKQADRLSHIYAIGKTGAGKKTLLETLAVQDIFCGRGCAVIDPHGDLAGRLVAHVPPSRLAPLVYLNAADPSQPYG